MLLQFRGKSRVFPIFIGIGTSSLSIKEMEIMIRQGLFVHSICTNFCLNVLSICANFGLNVLSICANFGLNTHSPIYFLFLLK